MVTLKEYAKKQKISERVARKRLERKVANGEMLRTRGDGNSFLYYERPKLPKMKWHDPFNLIGRAIK